MGSVWLAMMGRLTTSHWKQLARGAPLMPHRNICRDSRAEGVDEELADLLQQLNL